MLLWLVLANMHKNESKELVGLCFIFLLEVKGRAHSKKKFGFKEIGVCVINSNILLKKIKDHCGRIETVELCPARTKSKNSFEIKGKKRKEGSEGNQVRREQNKD